MKCGLKISTTLVLEGNFSEAILANTSRLRDMAKSRLEDGGYIVRDIKEIDVISEEECF